MASFTFLYTSVIQYTWDLYRVFCINGTLPCQCRWTDWIFALHFISRLGNVHLLYMQISIDHYMKSPPNIMDFHHRFLQITILLSIYYTFRLLSIFSLNSFFGKFVFHFPFYSLLFSLICFLFYFFYLPSLCILLLFYLLYVILFDLCSFICLMLFYLLYIVLFALYRVNAKSYF